jgi:hypothetical protein
MSYSKDLILIFGVWNCAEKPLSLSDDQAKMGCICMVSYTTHHIHMDQSDARLARISESETN